MRDRTVRRRRAVLGLLVVGSLILLTAYFGRSSGGPLRSVQRGVTEVFSPVQEGASRALKPVRDVAGWFKDTLHAKKDRDRLQVQVDTLRRQAVGVSQAQRENGDLRALLRIGKDSQLAAYGAKTARVTFRSPTLWFATIQIDEGSSAGVRQDDPVVGPQGLVGKVSDVTAHTAQVTLITDPKSSVSAEGQAGKGRKPTGQVEPAVGKPDDLLLDYVAQGAKVRRGQFVVTAGSRSNKLQSLFPPGIPIGEVTRVETQELKQYQRVHIRPFADLRELNFVQVLTNPDAPPPGSQQASAATGGRG